MKTTDADFASPHSRQGFTATSCGGCHRTANIAVPAPGWLCPCGHYNTLSFSNHQIPHESPSLGPTRQAIIEARSDR